MSTVIKVENISKQYRLGAVGTGSLAHDLNRTWHRLRGKEDPYLKIGDVNDRSVKGSSEYVWALQDINFEVKQGEVLGIIGRNGAGKSTLLKILSRTTTPTTGQIKIRGKVASLLEVGTGFHPELSGRENIFLNGAILGMTRHEIKSKFDEIVDFAGVERYIDTPVKRYSSGMYVRLAFGVAAHLEPEILIVDEVLAVGDAEFQKKALGKMKDVSNKDGRTVLFVSHNISAIENLCTRALLLHQGTVLADGNVPETIQKYNDYIKSKADSLIKDRTDRIGNGKVKIVDFYITSTDGEFLTTVKTGGDFNICIDFENNSFPDALKSTVVSFALVDSRNQVVFLVRSNFTNENFTVSAKRGRVSCRVTDFSLSNGIYNVMIFLGFGETEVYDLVENAGEMEVEGGDYFGTGNNGLPFLCKTLSRVSWAIEE